MARQLKTVAVSGGFDPLHVAHVRHIKAASKLGDLLVVMLNNDGFLMRKKGYVFMPLSERKEILQNLKDVDWVVETVDEDQTVARTLEMVSPDIFAKGGDRVLSNIPTAELDVCDRLGIEIVYKVGGDRVHSSQRLVDRISGKESKS